MSLPVPSGVALTKVGSILTGALWCECFPKPRSRSFLSRAETSCSVSGDSWKGCRYFSTCRGRPCHVNSIKTERCSGRRHRPHVGALQRNPNKATVSFNHKMATFPQNLQKNTRLFEAVFSREKHRPVQRTSARRQRAQQAC